jgi:hypothetical protein
LANIYQKKSKNTHAHRFFFQKMYFFGEKERKLQKYGSLCGFFLFQRKHHHNTHTNTVYFVFPFSSLLFTKKNIFLRSSGLFNFYFTLRGRTWNICYVCLSRFNYITFFFSEKKSYFFFRPCFFFCTQLFLVKREDEQAKRGRNKTHTHT